MKILNRQQFLDTPAGTLFSFGDGDTFYDLNVKTSYAHERWGTDFMYFDIIKSFESNGDCSLDSDDAVFYGNSREGLFDKEQLFLVYDKDDIAKMISVLQELL